MSLKHAHTKQTNTTKSIFICMQYSGYDIKTKEKTQFTSLENKRNKNKNAK